MPEVPVEHQSMLSNIPAELKALPQWVVTDGSKVPHDAKTGGPASVLDPSTWATFEQARSKLNGHFTNLGFVFTESDPFTGIDLDDKPTKPATDEDKRRHQRIIEEFDSYTERSRSGRGHHVIVKGSVPFGRHGRDGVEVYSTGRYFIITGDVDRARPIADRSELLATLVGEMEPAESVPLVEHEETQSDADLFAMAMRAANANKFNELCQGDWRTLGYPSQSEADYALLSILCHYSQSNEQVRRLFRMSALGKREKATRNDKYLDRCLGKIRAAEPPLVDASGLLKPRPAARLEARTITLDQMSSPPVEHFACGNLFPFGKASVLYAPQGAGKSAFLSQLAFTFAGHQGLISTFLGMDVREGGPVVVFSAEDTYDDWIRKAAAYRSAAPDASTALARALSRVHIIDKTEGVARFTEMVQLRAGSAAESMLRREARTTAEWRKLRDFAIEKGARLIIVETTSRLLDDEDNANMAALIGALGYLASETGAVVVLSHHPTKAASQANDSSPESARGGSALINNSRTAVSLFPAQGEALTQWRGMFAEQDILCLEHTKSTSSVRRQAPITLIRCPTPYGAILRLPEDALKDASPVVAEVRRKTVVAEEAAKAARLRRIYDVVRKFKEVNGGPLSANKLIDYKDQLGVGKNRVSLLVDEALEAGVLVIKTTDSKGRILDMIPGQRPADPAPEN